MYTLPTTLSDDIQYFGSLIDEFTEGRIEPIKFKGTRVPMGIYEQRKDGTFMVRIRCAGGFINPNQLKKVAEIAHKYKSELLHITTRQELQIQNLELNDTLLVLQNLKEIGLASKGGGGNTVRNILSSVDSGITVDEVFDVLPYAENLTSKLIAEPDSFTLPRKFKIAFSTSEKDTGYAAFNDLGFIAQIKDNKRGFKVFMGGSLGSKPMIGYELFEFAPEEDLFYITDAAKKLFSRYGNRKNKHKARLRFVFYKLGKEEVFRLFHEIYKEVKLQPDLKYVHKSLGFSQSANLLKPEILNTSEFGKWKERYVTDQKQALLKSVIIPFEHGNVEYTSLIKLAEFTSHFGEDVIRFSMRQNIHLRNIPEQYLGNVYNFLSAIGIDMHSPLLLNTMVTCTGADTCRLGICLAKGAGSALRKGLSKSALDLEKLSDLKINISGCPNSCGQQVAADLGFYGKVSRNNRMYPAYHIVAGATTGTNTKLAELVGEISAYDLPRFTVDLFEQYLNKQNKYKSFSDYISTEGKRDISVITARYNTNIPDFRDDKNYYFDWGSDSIFSLVNKGMGECSAGLFDMIDVDLNKINTNIDLIGKTTDKDKINKLLNQIIFSSVRMLLITRGEEPKNNREVYNSFLLKFIDARLISNIYREIITITRDNESYDYSDKKETILSLAQAVISLYENMDDSLQFKIADQQEALYEKEVKHQTRKKDFRGVACPMNFVKTKIELSSLKSGDLLEILLDDGEPIENVPGSIIGEGHKVLEQKKIDNYWTVTIQKT